WRRCLGSASTWPTPAPSSSRATPTALAGRPRRSAGGARGRASANPRAPRPGPIFFPNASPAGGLPASSPPPPPPSPPPPPHPRRRRGTPLLTAKCGGLFRGGRPVVVAGEDAKAPRPGRVPPFAGMPRLPGLPQVPVPVLGFADEAASRVGHVDPEVISYAQ